MPDEDELDLLQEIDPGDAIRKAREKGDAIDAEFESKLADIERRADEALARRRQAQSEQRGVHRESRESARGLGLGFSIGYAILGLPLLGYGIGWLIDRQLGTKTIGGFGMLIGATLGVVFAIVQLNRQQR
jgi:F0F1-type ATP synthase assembly protein I